MYHLCYCFVSCIHIYIHVGDGHVTLAELQQAMESEGNADILSEISGTVTDRTVILNHIIVDHKILFVTQVNLLINLCWIIIFLTSSKSYHSRS